jgi:hypothetical protein
MGNHKRIAHLEKSLGSERKMSWLEFITGDGWGLGGPPAGLENEPDTPPKPLSEYERRFHVRPDPFAEAK